MLFVLGCEKEMVMGKNEGIEMNVEIGILPKLMSLPKEPQEVVWLLEEGEHRDSGALTALLSYSATDYDYIVNNSSSFEVSSNASLEIEFFNKWVPESLKSSIKVEDRNGAYELIGIEPRQPALFTQAELSPYLNGSVIPLGKGQILVVLYAN